MAGMFTRNAWYCAAWSGEITHELHNRVILGEDILLFRDPQGRALAFANFCPHRSAPLHLGRVVDGHLQCPYHGLGFGFDGRCVHDPHQRPGSRTTAARLRVYPLVEKDALAWIWMGDPALAEHSAIPDFSCHTDPDLARVGGTLTIDAYYELVTDNLLDLTHVEYVHAGILGSSAISRGSHEIRQEGTTVWSSRWCPEGEAPPALARAFGNYREPVDHWLYMRWDAPASMLLDVGITPVGATRGEGWWVYGTDILTPVDEASTRYFWAITYATGVGDPQVAEGHRKAIQLAFVGQDKPMIEAQQRALRLRGALDVEGAECAFLPTDAAPGRVRLLLRKLASDGAGTVPESRNPSLSVLRRAPDRRDAAGRIVPFV